MTSSLGAERAALDRAAAGTRTGQADASSGTAARNSTNAAGSSNAVSGGSAAATGSQPISLVDLALVEGSDATGATAQALQSAQAATGGPAPTSSSLAPAMAPGVVVQAVGSGAPGTPASASASLDASLALSGAGDVRSRGGGADTASDGNAGSGAGAGGGNAGGTGAAALQQPSATQTSSSTTPAPTLRVHADVDSDDFPQAVADRVSFAVGNGWSGVKLSVNPPQLGPIELSIAIQGEHAQVVMSTHSAVTREALDTSAPKLKEMLNAQGFTQVSVDISQRSFQDRSSTPQQYAWTPPATSSAAAPAAAVVGGSSAAPRAAQGMLDAYA